MQTLGSLAAAAGIGLLLLTGGCVSSPDHRMNVAEARDSNRRAEFEHCRDQGRTDCDAILNAPVNSAGSSNRGDSVREQERRAAYDRCVDRGGTDCRDLLDHD